MAAETGGTTPQWFGVVTQFVAPATLVGGFLFYYGYVFTRKEYEYFGLDVDTIGLTTKDYVMRSPAALVVPLIVLTGLTVAVIALVHRADEAARAVVEAQPTDGPGLVARRAKRGIAAGAVVAAVGLALVLTASAWQDRVPTLELVATVAIAVGAAASAISLRHTSARLPGVAVALWAVVLTATLWSVSTTAEWSGAGHARDVAGKLRLLPAAVLDSPTDWHLPQGSGIVLEDLCATKERGIDDECAALTDQPRFRYKGYHLLVQGPRAMFFVPGEWRSARSTIMVPVDAPVRIRFLFPAYKE